MQRSLFLLIAFVLLGAHGRQLLAPNLAPSPLAGVRTGVLNLTDPDVNNWTSLFQRYYRLSIDLQQRDGTNKTASYATIYLLANAALGAAAAKNVESALSATPADTSFLNNAIAYSTAAGNQVIAVTQQPVMRQYASANITAYTQIAGEAAVETSTAALQNDRTGVSTAADRAVAAVQDGLSEAQGVIAPAPTPFDRPY